MALFQVGIFIFLLGLNFFDGTYGVSFFLKEIISRSTVDAVGVFFFYFLPVCQRLTSVTVSHGSCQHETALY